MRVRWSARAESDLYWIGDYIGRDDPNVAERWVEGIRERAHRAGTFPRSGRVVPEFEHQSIREVFVGNYRIVYLVETRGLLVLAVREGHEVLDDLEP